MKKLSGILLIMALLVSCVIVPAEAETAGTAPSYLTPSVFISRYNAMINSLAEIYAEDLGEEGVIVLNDEYTMTQVDIQSPLAYYGTAKWDIEAGFSYPEGTEPADDTPAQVMNFTIKAGTPDGAAEIATYVFRMIIAYEYQDEALLEELKEWFATVNDPANVIELPGYTLNAFSSDSGRQYAIIPADAAYRESVQEKLEQQASEPDPDPADDGDWIGFHCEEDRFTSKKPYDANYEYKTDKGYMGFRIYLDVPGYPPYVLIHRRPADGKFKDPENYLNNIYREFLENKYEGNGASVGTNPAAIREVGGKQLIGARYTIQSGNYETIQLQLIEIRDLGDVEYTAMFDPSEEEMVMKALNAAVANYVEDEAQESSKQDSFIIDEGDEMAVSAKEFIASFTSRLTEQDLLAFDLNSGDGFRYVLGKTTPREMTEDGWVLNKEDDGAFLLYDGWEEDTGIILCTEHGSMDKPILTVNAFADENGMMTYCGFDGQVGFYEDDPDEKWYPGLTTAVFQELVPEGDRTNLWDGLVNWLVTDFGAAQNEEGIYETKISLSDGRTLFISSHDSQVRISLIGLQ